MSHITSSLIICYYKKNQKVRKWKKHSSVLISTWKFWTLKESVDVVLCCRIGTERIVRLILAFCLTFSILDFERVQSCDSQEFKGTPCPESKIMNLPSRIKSDFEQKQQFCNAKKHIKVYYSFSLFTPEPKGAKVVDASE